MENMADRDILSLLPEELEAVLQELGEPKFRAAQIFQWLSRGVRDFDGMTNLPKALRDKLKASFRLYRPRVLSKQVSSINFFETAGQIRPKVYRFYCRYKIKLSAFVW